MVININCITSQLYISCILFTDSFTVLQNPEYIVAINSSVTLHATAEGPGRDHFRYQWKKNGSNLLPSTANGQRSPNLTIAPTSISDNGSYYCSVTNQWGTTIISNVGLVLVLSKCACVSLLNYI